MVVKHRSPSGSYIDTLQNKKYSLPYGDSHIDRTSSTGSLASTSQQWSPTVLESQAQPNKAKTRKFSSFVPTVIQITFFAAAYYSINSLHTEISSREKELVTIRNDFEHVENALLQNEAKVDSAHTLLFNLQSQFMSLVPAEHQNVVVRGEEFNGDHLYKKVVDRQNAMRHRVNDLQHTIANLHHGEALEHFGPHPYRLKFNVLLDGNSHSFIVEMAPLDLVPHSIHFFMQMVKEQVWNNMVFTHNTHHIVLAELMDIEGNDKRDVFLDKGISTLSFPEYSEDYPHKKYTLGFGGRPGGPGFYINTDDNREIHGPGGQVGYHLNEEADPCFAEVIEGHEVIDWMQQKNLDENDASFTVIESIAII